MQTDQPTDEICQRAAGKAIADAVERVLLQAKAKHGLPVAVVAGGALEAALRLAVEDMGAMHASMWLSDCAKALAETEFAALQAETTKPKPLPN